MKKYIVLSSTNNPDYLNYIPYVVKAWNNLGWSCLIFIVGDVEATDEVFANATLENYSKYLYCILKNDSKYSDATIAQVSRLYAGCMIKEGMIMTSDADMIPCCDYWHPNPNEITCYGQDLTIDSTYPMCYIAMSADKWREVMWLDYGELIMPALEDGLQNRKIRWSIDQEIITENLSVLSYPKELPSYPVTSILRERSISHPNFADRRHDRLDWEGTKDLDAIDAHMPIPFSKEAAEFIMNKYHNAKH